MKRLLLILSIAAGLIITGCGSEESGHTHGEGADHTHGEETHQHATGDQAEAAHQHEVEQDQGHSHDSSETTGTTHTHAGSNEEHSHSGEGAHSHEEEESGMMLGLNETYEQVRKGVRLTLSYNSDTGSFSGTVENTTQEALPQVSVQVELSNGTELGPTTPVNLDAGESQPVEVDVAGATFESWSAHSEMRSSGHSHGEEGDHEHHN